MNEKYHHGAHAVYLTQYHIVWCPKFRYAVLNGERQEKLKQILTDICHTYDYVIKAIEVMPDHIHLFIDIPQTVAPCDAVRTLKSISAVRLLKDDVQLRHFYAKCGVLWSPEHFVSSVGDVSADTVKRYIEEQNSANRETC